jgi:glutathione synthase/RimK-type ligase-like ATP-grasp enzyme
MPNKDVFILYSGATDLTGAALQKELDIEGGKEKPKTAKKLVIGYGAKTKDSVSFPAGVTVLNHPDKIRDNRNKYLSLQKLGKAKVPVAKSIPSENVNTAITSGQMKLPLVGRTNFHQGGAGFWLCITKSQVEIAIHEGAQYFQEYLDIDTEYRLHIFQGKLIWAQKKAKRDNMQAAFVEQYGEKIDALATKKGTKLDKATMDHVLGAMADRLQPNPDQIIRSNSRGWKFVHVKNENVNKDLLLNAIAAIKASELDFGAVDCCIDATGKAWIIEINSGPGLEESTFKAYVAEFKRVIDTILNGKATKASSTMSVPAAKSTTPMPAGGAKSKMLAQATLMAKLAEEATEEEAGVLESLWSRVASKVNG